MARLPSKWTKTSIGLYVVLNVNDLRGNRTVQEVNLTDLVYKKAGLLHSDLARMTFSLSAND